jgi:hypothetical protein
MWCRKLKQAAKELIDDAEWTTLYSCELVRTSRGRSYGMVVGSYGLGWWVFKATEGELMVDINPKAAQKLPHCMVIQYFPIP